MRYINAAAESPTPGIHRLLMLGPPCTNGHMWGMHANAYSKEWAWKLIEYFGGKTKGGEYLSAELLAKIIYTCAWPDKALQNPEINALWKESLIDLDYYQKQWDAARYVADVVPAYTAPWYLQWVDQTLVPNLQNCLAGEITADQAAGEIARGAEELNKA